MPDVVNPFFAPVIRTTDRIGGYRAAQLMLHLDPLPTAVFTVNNMTALGALQALRERALSVPEDIGLVCFDDVEHLAVLSPFLTVIEQPGDKAGNRGRRIVLQADLIVRQSCCVHTGVPARAVS